MSVAVVVNKKTRVPYLYFGDGVFENIHTGVRGEIKDADKFFVISVEFTDFVNRNPEWVNLVRELKLIIEKPEQ